MATTQNGAATKPATKLVPVGRAWKNVTGANSKAPGTEFLTLSIDSGRNSPGNVTLSPGDRVILYPNIKREGKKDADLRAFVEVAA